MFLWLFLYIDQNNPSKLNTFCYTCRYRIFLRKKYMNKKCLHFITMFVLNTRFHVSSASSSLGSINKIKYKPFFLNLEQFKHIFHNVWVVACAKKVLKSKIKMALTRKRRLIFQYSKKDTGFGNIPTLFWEKKLESGWIVYQ